MATYDVVQAVRKKQYTGNGTAGPFAFPFQINASAQIKVYVDSSGSGNPSSNGTQLYETGSGSNDEWYFDYQSGILHFIGDNLPTDIGTATSNVIYVAGAKYVGSTGIGSDASGASATFRKSNVCLFVAGPCGR